MQHSSSVTDFQQLWGRWTSLLNRLYDDPKVAQMMNTRMGRYLSSHPLFALTVMLFSAMAALPVGLFLIFALSTTIMSAVAFVFFEVFLLFIGGLILLCVLSGIALLSVLGSLFFNAIYVTTSNILSCYYPQLTKQGNVQGKERKFETSKLKEMQ
ncbi:lipid droplet assembly factor 1-like [Xiphias gladius]|uniref:lipid droplet assembly factor 1-like n=1 Tax=Xiphias gladius TaxID=8245 RepID=UPI001A99018F|nr:lipid droplet assembly factor 1-like [Xiphias gladius]